MYDIIFVADVKEGNTKFADLKNRHPLAKFAHSYEEAVEKSVTTMFWLVWDDIEILDTFKFDFKVPEEDKCYVHIFKTPEESSGLCLASKIAKVSSREIKNRFFINRREVLISSVKQKPYDIFFISYNEPNAEENWNNLISRFPRASRVDGIPGIHNAHKRAAELSTTEMFWVVDGDSVVADNFYFDLVLPKYDEDIVHVWFSSNPVNGLEYGYGGVKLLPRRQTLVVDVNSADMTTSISSKIRVVPTVANFTKFNTDPFNTWKSAFRECVKLSSKSIQGQVDAETQERLDNWCTVGTGDFSEYAIKGALAGRAYGQENAGNIPAISLINDFEWLKNRFQQTHLPSETHLQ